METNKLVYSPLKQGSWKKNKAISWQLVELKIDKLSREIVPGCIIHKKDVTA